MPPVAVGPLLNMTLPLLLPGLFILIGIDAVIR
jgi:hypothetical protein